MFSGFSICAGGVCLLPLQGDGPLIGVGSRPPLSPVVQVPKGCGDGDLSDSRRWVNSQLPE